MIRLIIVVGLGILIFISLQTQSIEVESVTVKYAPMKVVIEEEGKTKIIEKYSINAPIDAYMRRIKLSEGDDIKIGQDLIILEPLPSSVLDPSSRVQAEAVLGASKEMENIIKEISTAAKADQDLADISYKRINKLSKNKVIPEHELDIARVDKRRADAVYRASQFGWVFSKYLTKMSQSVLDYENIRNTEKDARSFKITSTTKGKIINLKVKNEGIVKAGELLMEIGDIKQMEVEVDVLSSAAVKLKPGMNVELDRWGGDELLYGNIKKIEPSGFTKISALGVEEQRVNIQCALPSSAGLRYERNYGFWFHILYPFSAVASSSPDADSATSVCAIASFSPDVDSAVPVSVVASSPPDAISTSRLIVFLVMSTFSRDFRVTSFWNIFLTSSTCSPAL